jgi:hypothetical protein
MLPLWSSSTLDWSYILGRRDVDHYFANVENIFLLIGHLCFKDEMWITSTLPLWSTFTLDWLSAHGRRVVDHIYFATVETSALG